MTDRDVHNNIWAALTFRVLDVFIFNTICSLEIEVLHMDKEKNLLEQYSLSLCVKLNLQRSIWIPLYCEENIIVDTGPEDE